MDARGARFRPWDAIVPTCRRRRRAAACRPRRGTRARPTPSATWSAGWSGSTPALDALVAPDARLEVLARGLQVVRGPGLDGRRAAVLRRSEQRHLALERDARACASSCGRAATPAPSRAAASPARTAWPSTPRDACTSASTATAASRASPARRPSSFETDRRSLTTASASTARTIWWCARTATSTSPIRSTVWSGTRRIRLARCPGAASTARTPTARVDVLDKTLTFPNGLAFSPDGKTLYVAVSDPARAIWMAYDVDAKGGVSQRARVLRRDVVREGRARRGCPTA